MWEKEKLFVMNNFSFSHIVFKRLALQTRKNQGLFGKGLILVRITVTRINLFYFSFFASMAIWMTRCCFLWLKTVTYTIWAYYPKKDLVFTGLQHKSFEDTVGKGEIACNKQFLHFAVFSMCLKNFLPFSSNLKLSLENSFSLEESKICRLGKS